MAQKMYENTTISMGELKKLGMTAGYNGGQSKYYVTGPIFTESGHFSGGGILAGGDSWNKVQAFAILYRNFVKSLGVKNGSWAVKAQSRKRAIGY